jgi:hypothetical protein
MSEKINELKAKLYKELLNEPINSQSKYNADLSFMLSEDLYIQQLMRNSLKSN